MNLGQAMEFKPPHPERTAVKHVGGVLDGKVVFQEWPNRQAMLKTIQLQGRREWRNGDWRPYVKPNY